MSTASHARLDERLRVSPIASSNAFLALVRDCCEPMRRHARQRRGLAAQNAAKFFCACFERSRPKLVGMDGDFEARPVRYLFGRSQKQQQQQPQQQQKQSQRHRQQKQRLPQKQQHSQKQDVGKGAAQATTRHHRAESGVHSAPSISPWYRGTGHEVGRTRSLESLLELLRDPMVRNAINQLATTEPELLGDLVFLSFRTGRRFRAGQQGRVSSGGIKRRRLALARPSSVSPKGRLYDYRRPHQCYSPTVRRHHRSANHRSACSAACRRQCQCSGRGEISRHFLLLLPSLANPFASDALGCNSAFSFFSKKVQAMGHCGSC